MIDDGEEVSSAESNGSGNTAPVVPVPDLAGMINASFGNGATHDEPTALEGLQITFSGSRGDDDDEPLTGPVTDGVPRKRRGRPPGSVNAVPAKKKADLVADLEKANRELADLRARNDANKIEELSKNLQLAAYFGFHFAAEQRGAHWELEEKEAEDIGESGAVALAPWADKIAKHLPWGVFAMTLLKTLNKRIEIDRKRVADLRASGQIP